jgi:hypothetical protein
MKKVSVQEINHRFFPEIVQCACCGQTSRVKIDGRGVVIQESHEMRCPFYKNRGDTVVEIPDFVKKGEPKPPEVSQPRTLPVPQVPQPDDAPYGRKADGTPKKRPGRPRKDAAADTITA